ncbi:hypothetical protein F5Y01DRAFT_74413 [Xylaria sp. FL0043]|nr:hypothetical protein F5Y01DRAFT_74413 [Xylaria sp. FL0043]
MKIVASASLFFHERRGVHGCWLLLLCTIHGLYPLSHHFIFSLAEPMVPLELRPMLYLALSSAMPRGVMKCQKKLWAWDYAGDRRGIVSIGPSLMYYHI